MASWIGLAKDLKYDLRKRDVSNKEIKVVSVLTEKEAPEFDLAAITEAKSLYDNLMKQQ